MTLRDNPRWPSEEGAGPGARLPLFEAAAQLYQQEWHHGSACREADPELFFPVGEGPAALAQAEEAKSYCRRCPVVTECLKHALNTPIPDGIWGGLTEKERRALKRRKART
jgi:WhiB family redox-sensing transcriptional regulator